MKKLMILFFAILILGLIAFSGCLRSTEKVKGIKELEGLLDQANDQAKPEKLAMPTPFLVIASEKEEIPPTLPAEAQLVSFVTADGVTIYANYYPTQGIYSPAIILFHEYGQDKSVWHDFALRLQKQGYAVLALDLRGHGQSTKQNGVTINYTGFVQAEFKNMLFDADAAKEFMKKQINVNPDQITFIGASLGSSVALLSALNDVSVRNLVMLSPGLEYKGLEISSEMNAYGRRMLLMAAAKKDFYSHDSMMSLIGRAKGAKKIVSMEGSAHGTELLEDQKLLNEILAWIER